MPRLILAQYLDWMENECPFVPTSMLAIRQILSSHSLQGWEEAPSPRAECSIHSRCQPISNQHSPWSPAPQTCPDLCSQSLCSTLPCALLVCWLRTAVHRKKGSLKSPYNFYMHAYKIKGLLGPCAKKSTLFLTCLFPHLAQKGLRYV